MDAPKLMPSIYISRNVDRYVECYDTIKIEQLGSARGVMVIVVGDGHGDTSSNPGRDWLHFTYL